MWGCWEPEYVIQLLFFTFQECLPQIIPCPYEEPSPAPPPYSGSTRTQHFKNAKTLYLPDLTSTYVSCPCILKQNSLFFIGTDLKPIKNVIFPKTCEENLESLFCITRRSIFRSYIKQHYGEGRGDSDVADHFSWL